MYPFIDSLTEFQTASPNDFETTRLKENSKRLTPAPCLVVAVLKEITNYFSTTWLPRRPATGRPVALHPEEEREAPVVAAAAERRDRSPFLSKSSRPLARAFPCVYNPTPR